MFSASTLPDPLVVVTWRRCSRWRRADRRTRQSTDTTDTDATTADSTTDSTSGVLGERWAVWMWTLFLDGALAEEVTTEDCTLSGGEETTCYQHHRGGVPDRSRHGSVSAPRPSTDGARRRGHLVRR